METYEDEDEVRAAADADPRRDAPLYELSPPYVTLTNRGILRPARLQRLQYLTSLRSPDFVFSSLFVNFSVHFHAIR